jgi:hypothetical protein
MICPKCNQDTLSEESAVPGEVKMVTCSNCHFQTTLLEYHAWKDIHEKRPPHKIVVGNQFRNEPTPFDFSETYDKLGELWNTIKTPMMIIIFLVMLVLIIVIARR